VVGTLGRKTEKTKLSKGKRQEIDNTNMNLKKKLI
jgi:hypothetical protein